METLVKSLFPALLTLITTGGLFGFILSLLQRHDKNTATKKRAEREKTAQERINELAFWHSKAYAVSLLQIVGPAVVAHEDGDDEAARAMFLLLRAKVCSKDAAGKWEMAPVPDFLEMARDDFEKMLALEAQREEKQ